MRTPSIRRLCAGFICLASATLAQQHPTVLFDSHKLPDDWADRSVLARRLPELAGKDARNCGRARVNDDPRRVTECALGTYAARKAFYARYDVQGIDVDVAVGFAFDGTTAYKLTWDYGGLRVVNRENLHVEICSSPFKLFSEYNWRVGLPLLTVVSRRCRQLALFVRPFSLRVDSTGQFALSGFFTSHGILFRFSVRLCDGIFNAGGRKCGEVSSGRFGKTPDGLH
jgi:hypothetical protein